MAKNEKIQRGIMFDKLQKMGLSRDEVCQLRRISMTLRRWFELECGTSNAMGSDISVQRGEMVDGVFVQSEEDTAKPFLRIGWRSYPSGTYLVKHDPTADKERGAKARLAAIMARHKTLGAYIQTDPRGCALHIYTKAALRKYLTGLYIDISCCYPSVATAVW